MIVSVRDARGVVASTEVGGRLLAWPARLKRVDCTTGPLLELPSAGGTGSRFVPDVVVGAVPLLVEDQGGSIHLLRIDVPPPVPFTTTSIEQMVEVISGSPLPMPPSVLDQGRIPWRGPRSADPEAVDVAVLRQVDHLATGMLAAWPTDEDHKVAWRPLEVRGGREDVRLTERFAGRRAHLAPSGRRLPERSARRLGSTRPWRSSMLAASARQASAIVAWSYGDDACRLREKIDLVADRADPRMTTADTPPSAWPQHARLLYGALSAIRSMVAPRGAGGDGAPLTRLWELYEAWVATICFRGISDHLGDPTESLRAGRTYRARWTGKGRVTELAIQPTFSAGAVEDGTRIGRLLSITSDLRPDVVLVTGDDAGATDRVWAIDAKLRRSEQLTSVSVAEAASKYLWGVRNANDPALPVLEGVLLCSPMQPSSAFDPVLARTTTIEAHPESPEGLYEAVSALL